VSSIPFWKIESIGNDFPLLHADETGGRALEDLAIILCDRRFGIGGDGLLVLEKGEPLKLRMFNPDGTEDFCGNGLRCAAVHAHAMGWVEGSFEILHGGQTVPVSIRPDGTVATTLAGASYSPARVPLREGAEEIYRAPVFWDEEEQVIGSAITTGSTHVVVPVLVLPDDGKVMRLGPKIEHFELYPIRTSVIWVEEVAEDHLKIRIWERGVGETMGCGTGSSAAAADYLRGKGRGGRVRVDNPGGTVWITAALWDAPISVEGTAEATFDGDYALPDQKE
jgi:diaminopimelate epimerase